MSSNTNLIKINMLRELGVGLASLFLFTLGMISMFLIWPEAVFTNNIQGIIATSAIIIVDMILLWRLSKG